MQSQTSLTPIDREIIADIQAVCRRCGWPTDLRPKFEAYLERRGHFYEKQIKRLGGWKKLCARGGMHGAVLPALPAPPALGVADEQIAPDLDGIVADVHRVARSLRLKPGDGLTFAVYRRSGGRYRAARISGLGGWSAVSAAAGVPSRGGGGGGGGGGKRERRCQPLKVQRTLTDREFDRALDRAMGRTPVPRGILCIMGLERRKFRPAAAAAAVRREAPVLARGEVIADVRQVALGLGLLSPRLLSFDAYRRHDGRYTYEQISTLGGFDALRRVA